MPSLLITHRERQGEISRPHQYYRESLFVLLIFGLAIDLEQTQTRGACPVRWASEAVNRRWQISVTCNASIPYLGVAHLLSL